MVLMEGAGQGGGSNVLIYILLNSTIAVVGKIHWLREEVKGGSPIRSAEV